MLAAAIRAILAVLTRAVAVVVGLLVAFYVQLGGDIGAPVAVQIDSMVVKLREMSRILHSLG